MAPRRKKHQSARVDYELPTTGALASIDTSGESQIENEIVVSLGRPATPSQDAADASNINADNTTTTSTLTSPSLSPFPSPTIINNQDQDELSNNNLPSPAHLTAVPDTNQEMQQPVTKKRTARRSCGTVAKSADSSEDSDEAPPPTKRRAVNKKSQASSSTKANKDRSRPTKKAIVSNRRSTKWNPDNVTSSTKSPLVNVNLRSLLLQPAAWDCLTEEDRAEVLAQFPDETHILDAGTPNARPNLESLRNDDSFRHDAEEYTSNLCKGMHDPIWLRDAWSAHGRRAAGEFDAYYVRKLEIEWDTTIPDDFKPAQLRSDANGHRSPSDPNDEHAAKPSRGNTPEEKQAGAREGSLPGQDTNVDNVNVGMDNQSTKANGTTTVLKADGPRFEVIPEGKNTNGEVKSNDAVIQDASQTKSDFKNAVENKDYKVDANGVEASEPTGEERSKKLHPQSQP